MAFATSAVRDATDSTAVLERVQAEAGVDLQVLPGEDEARLTMSIGETSNIGTPPTPLPTLGWMGMVASAVQALTKVTALATFQAHDFLLLLLTPGPKMAAPDCSPSFICWCGQRPARRTPSYSSCPWKPSTISAAMLTSTGMSVVDEIVSQAVAAAVVEDFQFPEIK